MLRHLLAPLSIALPALTLTTTARADLPEVAFGPAFEQLCTELKAGSECPDCTCTALTSTSPTADLLGVQPALAHAIVVKLENTVSHETPYRVRYFIALGSDDKLFSGGEIERVDSTPERATYTEFTVNKGIQVNDSCVSCDHEGVGLVHLVDLTLAKHSTYEEEGVMWEEHESGTILIACFGKESPACYGVPLGMTTQKDRPPMAPNDPDAKKGKKESVSRTWKMGGRNKLQVVLSAFSGNMAKAIKGSTLDNEPREFHFGDIPSRESTLRLRR